MGLETRIGIVAGLVIVVIASVYFYYGENRAEEDLLLGPPIAAGGGRSGVPAAGEPSALVLKIPAVAEPRQPGRSSKKDSSPAAGPWRATTDDRVARKSGAPAPTPATYAFADRPSAGAPVVPQPQQSAVALRSSPSALLTESTEKNLDDPPLDPIGLSETLSRGPSAPPHSDATPTTPRIHRPGAADAAKPGSSQPRAFRRHIIVSGDTLAALAQRYLGDERKTSLILAANPGLNPRNLKLGAVVMIPDAGESTGPRLAAHSAGPAAAPPVASGRSYVVRSGDTLYRIAAREMGSGPRWKEILPLNRDALRDDPKRLRPGMTIRLPN